MRDANDLVRSMKKAAVDAVNATKPVAFFSATVTSVAPLQVSVDQKLILGEMQLVMLDGLTGRIAEGDTVMLARMQGGQRFILIDKVVDA